MRGFSTGNSIGVGSVVLYWPSTLSITISFQDESSFLCRNIVAVRYAGRPGILARLFQPTFNCLVNKKLYKEAANKLPYLQYRMMSFNEALDRAQVRGEMIGQE